VTTIGVLGGSWRATVEPDGTITPCAAGSRPLRWHVAADDRWHTPATSSTRRQRAIDGVPVIETRIRIPSGDAVHRVYAVADHGGMTVIEVENDSPLPIAVAFDGPPLSSPRPPTVVPIDGIELPSDTVVFPIGHRATVTVALAHAPSRARALSRVPAADQVVRGWTVACERAGRLLLPDVSLTEAVTAARCDLLLGGPDDLEQDPVGHVIGVAELARLGVDPGPGLPELAEAVHAVARSEPSWERDVALDSAERVLSATGERRALRDLARIRSGAPTRPHRPDAAPVGARVVPWVEQILARGDELLPGGVPPAWAGQSFEGHGLPAGSATTVSFAVRWHGDRPAVLWETAGRALTLRSPVAAPGWSSDAVQGETLWPPHRTTAGV
jgi:hypothetical protein